MTSRVGPLLYEGVKYLYFRMNMKNLWKSSEMLRITIKIYLHNLKLGDDPLFQQRDDA